MFSILSFFYFCVYFPRMLYALPNPEQSASLVYFADFSTASGIVTEFLVPSGTSSGATTFEFVEVYSITEESFSGTVTVPEPTVSTLTGELVVSTSGFALEVTQTISYISGAASTFTEDLFCQATASDSGECKIVELNGATASVTGTASTRLLPISTLTSTSTSVSPTSGSSKNGGSKLEYNQKMLAGLVFGTTILGICSGGFLVL